MDLHCKNLLAELISSTGKNERKRISKLVMVTSLQFAPKAGEKMSVSNMKEISFDSWREDEYKNEAMLAMVKNERVMKVLRSDWCALTNKTEAPETLDDNQIFEVLHLKYHFAGGSARYMFDTAMFELLGSVKADFGRVSSPVEFTRTSIAANTDFAVNSLMQQFHSVTSNYCLCTPVSKYVLLLAYDKCRTELTKAVNAVADDTDIDSLKGWAFELEQRDEIRSALSKNIAFLELHPSEVTLRDTVTNSRLSFSPRVEATFDGSSLMVESGTDVTSGLVIWCSKDNQPLFDAALYFDKTLVTLEFTISSKHKLNLEYMAFLRRALLRRNATIERVVHMGIVKKESVEGFKFKPATGQESVTTRKMSASIAAANQSASHPYPTFKVVTDKADQLKAVEKTEANEVLVGDDVVVYTLRCL